MFPVNTLIKFCVTAAMKLKRDGLLVGFNVELKGDGLLVGFNVELKGDGLLVGFNAEFTLI
jgi:hypothetical protein